MVIAMPMDTSRWPQPRNQRKGFLLLDVLLGITIFSIFVGFASFSLLFSEQLAMKSGDRARAYALSEQALEAARSIRNSG
ncbi:MAG: type II secretion system protein, partial [Candidatus Peribacteraceae bacterium]